MGEASPYRSAPRATSEPVLLTRSSGMVTTEARITERAPGEIELALATRWRPKMLAGLVVATTIVTLWAGLGWEADDELRTYVVIALQLVNAAVIATMVMLSRYTTRAKSGSILLSKTSMRVRRLAGFSSQKLPEQVLPSHGLVVAETYEVLIRSRRSAGVAAEARLLLLPCPDEPKALEARHDAWRRHQVLLRRTTPGAAPLEAPPPIPEGAVLVVGELPPPVAHALVEPVAKVLGFASVQPLSI